MKRYRLMKRLSIVVILISILAIVNPKTCVFAEGPKNVILLIMDGTSSDAVTLSRWYKGSSLALDEIVVGGVRTYSDASAITDSAAAGTAMATGYKTLADRIGMIPLNGQKRSVPTKTVLEAAKEMGYATGVVATSPVQHATPAAFTSHVEDRDQFGDIGEQQVYQGLDVVLGGGKAWLQPQQEGKVRDDNGMLKTKEISREDGEDLIGVIKDNGYSYVEDREQLFSLKTPAKLWGAFANEDLAYEFDRVALHPKQPSLSDMTSKAIDVLSQNKKGFFLMVEGSKIDWAAHQNDPVGMISDVLSFDAAVSKALQFARTNENTMVIAVTDHGNSGLTIGNKSTNKDYKTQPVENFIKPLKEADLTVEGAISLLKEDRSNIEEVLASYGLSNLSKKEWCHVREAKKIRDLEDEMVKMLAKRAQLGFTTHGHTGEDVFLYAYGPGKPTGLIDNTDIAKSIASYMGLPSMSELFQKGYLDATEYFKQKGYDVDLSKEERQNPELVLKNGANEIRIPENKNFLLLNNKKVELEGVNVFNGNTFYIRLSDETANRF